MPTNKSLDTFQNLYFREYGVWLSKEKTFELASNLVNLYQAVYLESGERRDQGNEEKIRSTQN
jgi:hypothetical protein